MMISQMRNVRAVLCAAGLSVCALVAADECNFRADSAKNGLKRELRILSNTKSIIVLKKCLHFAIYLTNLRYPDIRI